MFTSSTVSDVENAPLQREAEQAGEVGQPPQQVESPKPPQQRETKTPMRISTLRGWCAFVVVLLVVAGLALHGGVGTPSAFGVQQISAICPLGALETMFGLKGVLLHPLILLLLVLVAIVFFGKAFCAWMCPVPWLQKFFRGKKGRNAESVEGFGNAEEEKAAQLVKTATAQGAENVQASEVEEGALGSRSRAETGTEHCASCAQSSSCKAALAPVGGKRDGVQIDSRHLVLAGTLGTAALFGFPVFCLVCPVGITFATIIGIWNLFQFNEPSWGLLIFPVILLLEVTVLRKWCHTLCPISALVGLVSSANRTLRPRVNNQACLRTKGVDCQACVKSCPEQVDPHTGNIPECSKCGACIEACPAKAIAVKLLG